jgi:WD40-like Beta Propeller Repeat
LVDNRRHRAKPGPGMSGYWRVALGIVAAVLLTVSEANADVVAVIDHKVPSPSRTDNDIVLVNAGTGAVSPVAFDTTSSDEIHPTVSSDGSRIAYESFNPSDDVSAIKVSDLQSGQTAGVRDQVDPERVKFDSVGISPDGRTVLTSSPCLASSSGGTGQVFFTTLSNFPTGPFAQSAFSITDPNPCVVSSPALSGPLPTSTGSIRLAAATLTQYTATAPNGSSEIIITNFNKVLSSDTADYSDPSLGSPGGVATLLFEESSSQPNLSFPPRRH